MKGLFGGEAVYKKIWEQRKARSPRRSAGAPGLNCLVLGGGGREYAIAWRLANCKSVTTIDVVPGNAGLSLFTRVLDQSPTNVTWLDEHVLASFIDLAIVGTRSEAHTSELQSPNELVCRILREKKKK